MRRVSIAFAASIAVHEVAAGVIPRGPATAPPQREIVTNVQILRVVNRVAVKPAPQPRPTIGLAAVSPPAHRIRVVADVAHKRVALRRASAARPAPASAQRYGSKPVWDVSSGSSAGQLAAAQTGDSAGSGSSGGQTGTGSGVASGAEPCGFVEFSDPHGSAFEARTHGFYVDIRMQVHFADGTSQSVVLDYPWYYSSESANPWSDQNLRDPNFPTRFQPPPQSKLENEPELVRYVIAHSTADGMTLLRDCPSPAP